MIEYLLYRLNHRVHCDREEVLPSTFQPSWQMGRGKTGTPAWYKLHQAQLKNRSPFSTHCKLLTLGGVAPRERLVMPLSNWT